MDSASSGADICPASDAAVIAAGPYGSSRIGTRSRMRARGELQQTGFPIPSHRPLRHTFVSSLLRSRPPPDRERITPLRREPCSFHPLPAAPRRCGGHLAEYGLVVANGSAHAAKLVEHVEDPRSWFALNGTVIVRGRTGPPSYTLHSSLPKRPSVMGWTPPDGLRSAQAFSPGSSGALPRSAS
jgi:hypothetical protein